ncbi:uncharacterized protein LOC135698245 [Ochlerotatus camptorhynchus]|uniref:uncharacterized protein LOC135698245 n=1 Tax=Ochlerotatus camptorhynchus TaxID=644619 RepID=UPI0031CF7B30
MEQFVLENNGRRMILNHSMRAQEIMTTDCLHQVKFFPSTLLNQQITPLDAGNFLRVRFAAEMNRDNNASESSRMQQMTKLAKGAVQWTGWTFGVIAGASYKAAAVTANVGKQAYRKIADSPVPGLVVRFPGVLIGSAVAIQLWGTVMGSCVTRQVLRATCIRHFIGIHSWLHLPASLRATAVLTGVRTSQYITAGIVPGLFTAWAIYDGYRLASFVYSQYHEHYNMNSKL